MSALATLYKDARLILGNALTIDNLSVLYNIFNTFSEPDHNPTSQLKSILSKTCTLIISKGEAPINELKAVVNRIVDGVCDALDVNIKQFSSDPALGLQSEADQDIGRPFSW